MYTFTVKGFTHDDAWEIYDDNLFTETKNVNTQGFTWISSTVSPNKKPKTLRNYTAPFRKGNKKKMMDHAVTILPLITKQGLKTFKQTRYWDITSPTLASRTGLYCCLHSGGRSPSWPSPGLALPLFCSFPKEIHIYTSINQDKEVTWEFVELLFLVKVSLPLVQQTSARINNNDGFRILNNVRLFKTFR